jgi:hypothetical protein
VGVALEPVNEKPVSLNVAFAKAQPVGTRGRARRWIGRRLHAGKYILGITAPTGTGVQALPPGDLLASSFDSSYIGNMLWRVRSSRGRPAMRPPLSSIRASQLSPSTVPPQRS